MTKPVLVYDVHEKPTIGRWVLLSLQHVLAMFGATVLVPMITGLPISATLISAGIGTLIYIFMTRGKSPVFLGSSFAYIVPVISGLALGVAKDEKNYGAVMIGLILVGIVYCLVALIIKFAGTEWINIILPPVVIGPVIMVIGLGLANVAVGMVMYNGGSEYNLKYLAVAFITLLTAVLVANYTKGITKLIPIMIGIITGYIASLALGLVQMTTVFRTKFLNIKIKLPTKVVDSMDESFLGLFQLPDFALLREDLFGFLVDDPMKIFQIMMIFIPVAIVTISEHIGDHLVLSSIIGKDLTKNPGLSKTLLGDGLATLTAGIIGGPANTTYGENTGVIGITKVASVWVIGTAAIIAFALGFIAPFTALISTIPTAVMGGISMMLFGIIASSGVRVLINNRVDFTKERNLMVASVVLVSGIGGLVIKIGLIELSSMAVAAILGIILHQILPEKKSGYGDKFDVVKNVVIDGEIMN